MTTKTVYISVGNSDDKLTQRQWASFHERVDGAIGRYESQRHGAWESWSVAAEQNACWCIEIAAGLQEIALKNLLAKYAAEHGQGSIAWAEADMSFIKPGDRFTAVLGEGDSK